MYARQQYHGYHADINTIFTLSQQAKENERNKIYKKETASFNPHSLPRTYVVHVCEMASI